MSTHNAAVIAATANSAAGEVGGASGGGPTGRVLGLGARRAGRSRAGLWVAVAGSIAALVALSCWGPAQVGTSAIPGVLGRSGGAAASAGATLTGGTVAPGSTFSVVAAGFKPGERVRASLRKLDSSRVVHELGFARASALGRLEGTFMLPRGVKRGCYALYLSGLMPGGTPLSDQVELCAT